jgi:uncharacterized protein YndB with AHSA1/START domain
MTHGTYEEIEGRPALRFERRYPHAVDAVWRAITDPAELEHWFPSAVELEELRAGARITFTFREHAIPPMHGEVLELDPPRLVAFTWGDEELRFELESEEGETVLHFTHVLSQRDAAARDAAGWTVCLNRLGEQLGGGDATAPGSEPTDEWSGYFEEYERRGFPTGAPIPEQA